ncbi:hypothetical protein U27_05573 [Candidatus Vecturithrix granuli]|uniref:DUF1152 domain-containing protein n=1 Tax=Vecturithrix granuli TaxID=1499967 RepID=A0A081C1Z4_VECG1|nr:hypothetical protein U27_05573 [Candidatus Vecturithrix granuli]
MALRTKGSAPLRSVHKRLTQSVSRFKQRIMELNLPIFTQLAPCQNVLIAGMGGGFDTFCGLPLYFELQRRGQKAHLANFSFSDIVSCTHGTRLTDTLVGVTADYNGLVLYFPELYLAQWFEEKRREAITVWCFQKTGARPLLENYRVLLNHLSIDGILLIDGGVDSLIQGDEAGTGTLIEDATSLFVVNELKHLPVRIVACIGFGAEQDLAYAHVLENIAVLTQDGGFLGACALTPHMEAYQAYEEAVLYVQGKDWQDASVINSSIISAVQGHYGDYHLTKKTRGSRLWISPLMSIYWFFDAPILAQRNLYLSQLRETETFMDALQKYMSYAGYIPRRPHARIPLP